MSQFEQSAQFKAFTEEFCSNSLKTKTSENSDAYLSYHDSEDIFPRKYVWLIHNLDELSTRRKFNFCLSNNDGEISISYDYAHARFMVSSTKHLENSAFIFQDICAKISVLSARNEPVLESDWTSCNNRNIAKFRERESLSLGRLEPFIYGALPFHGKRFTKVLLVGLEFDFDKNKGFKTSILKPEEHTQLVMSKIYNKLDYADVEVNIKKIGPNGTNAEINIFAHSAILSANSTFFDTMLQSNFVNGKFPVIQILDFEPNVVLELLKYFYTGEADVRKFAFDLIKISDKYQVEKLFQACQEHIGEHIPKYGWEPVFGLLHTYGNRVRVLKDLVIQYYKKHQRTLRDSPDFQIASGSMPEIFSEILCLTERVTIDLY